MIIDSNLVEMVESLFIVLLVQAKVYFLACILTWVKFHHGSYSYYVIPMFETRLWGKMITL